MVLQVLGQVDRGHPARAELPLQVVTVSEGGGEAVPRIGHGMSNNVASARGGRQQGRGGRFPGPGAGRR